MKFCTDIKGKLFTQSLHHPAVLQTGPKTAHNQSESFASFNTRCVISAAESLNQKNENKKTSFDDIVK